MSDLLNSASLVMIPSGYKEDVVYSQIPTDGSGDLTFARASNGTRINSAGLVEVCSWNFCDYSEDQTQWTSQNETTVTANSTTAPNGTTTADTVTPSTANDDHYRGIVLGQQVGALTAFIYVKPNGYNFFDWGIWNGSQYIVRATFDLVNLTYTFTNAGTATIESVGNGWLKCGISGTNASLTTMSLYYRSRPTGGTGAFTGNGTSGAFIWGAQLNIGSTAKPYFPTTDRLNVPRLTYQNGGGGCPSLLLEKQSTNLVTYSEQFDNAAWLSTGGITVTANSTTSPDGTQNADLFNHGNFNTYLYEPLGTSSGTITTSIFVKKGSESSIAFGFVAGGFTGGMSVKFNFDTQTFSTPINYANFTSISATYESYGNGWYRLNLTGTTATSTSYYYVLGSLLDSFAVNAYLWGAQVEASSYATSYIPTTSSSATRVADVATVNLPNTNMTFTAYLELDEASLGTAAGDWFSIYSNVSVLGRAYGYANTFGFADAYNLGVVSGAKMVWKQESGSTAKIFKGGALVGTSTTGTYTDPFNRLRMDGALLDKPMKIKQFVFFDNALTDAECAQLTA